MASATAAWSAPLRERAARAAERACHSTRAQGNEQGARWNKMKQGANMLVTRSKLFVSILGKYANCVDALFHYTIRRFLLSEDDKGKDSSKSLCNTWRTANSRKSLNKVRRKRLVKQEFHLQIHATSGNNVDWQHLVRVSTAGCRFCQVFFA